jgi:hypothetical protein
MGPRPSAVEANMVLGIRGWENGCNITPCWLSSVYDTHSEQRQTEEGGWNTGERAENNSKEKEKLMMNAPSFLALSLVKIFDLTIILPLALRRRLQRVLHLALKRRRMKCPKVLGRLAKNIFQRQRLENLVRARDKL